MLALYTIAQITLAILFLGPFLSEPHKFISLSGLIFLLVIAWLTHSLQVAKRKRKEGFVSRPVRIGDVVVLLVAASPLLVLPVGFAIQLLTGCALPSASGPIECKVLGTNVGEAIYVILGFAMWGWLVSIPLSGCLAVVIWVVRRLARENHA